MTSNLSSPQPRSHSLPRRPSRSFPFPSETLDSIASNASTGEMLNQSKTSDTSNVGNSGLTQPIPNSQSFNSESSKRTSSDKLSALPPSLPASPRSRYPIQNPSRNFRRSLDGSPRDSPSGSPMPSGAYVYRTSASEGSLVGKESPRQGRISFESEHSAGTLRSIRQVAARIGGHSDKPAGASPSAGVTSLPASNPRLRSDSQSSRSRSRATSPLRLFQWPLHRIHSREEPFVAIDPFKWQFRICNPPTADSTDAEQSDDQANCLEGTLPFPCCIPLPAMKSSSTYHALLENSKTFLLDTLPQQLYLNLLLHLPSLYFSRVARIFEDAEVSKADMQRVIDSCQKKTGTTSVPTGRLGGRVGGAIAPSNTNENLVLPYPEEWVPPTVSPALARFKRSWEEFMDSLMREWKTLNLVSGLLCSAILSMFQVPDMANDPVTRTAALLSLVCALMSLSYGCMFIVRFGTMRSMYRASRWAEEAQRSKTSIFWNVWVLLAAPAVWLAWSMISFIISILSYVWRTGATNDPLNSSWAKLTPEQSLGPRLAITFVVALGLVYFALIVKTFAKYASPGPNNDAIGANLNRFTERAEARVERGRASLRDFDKKSGKDQVSVSVRPSGVGLGLGGFTSTSKENGLGGSREVDSEKDAGIELEARGRLKPKL